MNGPREDADLRFEDRMDPSMVPILRAKSPRERLAMLDGMWRSAREMLSSLVQSEHPGWSKAQVSREVASRLSHGVV